MKRSRLPGRERDFFLHMKHAVKSLPDAEAAYIAGVIDGEGSISLMRHHGAERRRAAVTVANTELPMLEYLKATIGAGRITRKRVTRAHHTPSFTYVIYSRQALALLAQVAPYLRTHKRHRAALLLQSYLALTPRNGRYTPEQAAARAAFEAEFLAIRLRAPNRMPDGAERQGTATDAGHSHLHGQPSHGHASLEVV